MREQYCGMMCADSVVLWQSNSAWTPDKLDTSEAVDDAGEGKPWVDKGSSAWRVSRRVAVNGYIVSLATQRRVFLNAVDIGTRIEMRYASEI